MRYVFRRADEAAVRGRLKVLAQERPRFGYKRLCVLLRRENIMVNHKKVYRLYCEEGLKLRSKKGRRLKSELRGQPATPMAAGEVWTMEGSVMPYGTGGAFGP